MKGIYNRVRSVVDLKDMYWLVTECLYCPKCSVTIQAWDDQLLKQLISDVRAWFPAMLTRKYACDLSVVTLFRARTLGNSSMALTNSFLEVHSEEWLRRNLAYLGDCHRHKMGIRFMLPEATVYKEPLPFPAFPKQRAFSPSYINLWNAFKS